MKQSELNDEPLSWLACRYISDEMSDTELDAFESRLNPDSSAFELAACEAVARAVQLNDAVAVASEAIAQPAPQIVGEQTSRRDVVARRVSLVAASVTVLAVGWALTLPTSPQREVVDSPAPQPFESTSDLSGELVLIWADSGDKLLSAVEEAHVLPGDDLPEYLSPDVPDWLIAAVQTSDVSSTSPEVMEN
jgi:hypothetical protein